MDGMKEREIERKRKKPAHFVWTSNDVSIISFEMEGGISVNKQRME